VEYKIKTPLLTKEGCPKGGVVLYLRIKTPKE
jgi:hypothetical protein